MDAWVSVLWIAAIAGWFAWRILRRPHTPWTKVAQQLNLGLWDDPTSGYLLAGRVGEFNLRVTHQPDGWVTDFRVESRQIPRDLFLRGESYLATGDDIELGDRAFDKRVRVRGDVPTLFALLNRKNRAWLLEFIGKKGGVIESGTVRLTAIGGIRTASSLKSTIYRLIEVAGRLSLPRQQIPERLAHNATSRDLLPIRLRNLELLQFHYGDDEIARQASLKVLKDRRSLMRLQGAIFLRELEMLGKIAALESEPVDTRLKAIRFLVEEAPPGKILPLLVDLLGALAPAVRIEAIRDLGELGHRPALDKICRLAESSEVEIALVAAAALGKMGDRAAEPTLLNLLERGDEKLKIAAARALGFVGTRGAVEPLLGLKGGLLQSELGRTAGEAVARIQSRLGDVEAGRLTLAELDEKEGALSLSGEGGELSLHDQDRPIPPRDTHEPEDPS